MHKPPSIRAFAALRHAVVIVLAVSWGSSAPSPAVAEESCVPLNLRVPRSYLDDFKNNPVGYLHNPRGNNRNLNGLVASYVTSDPGLLESVKSLIARADREQRHAIGLGLATAAATCQTSRPSVGFHIEALVRKISDENVLGGFESFRTARTVTLPAGRKPSGGGGELLKDEDGEKLADPFGLPELR